MHFSSCQGHGWLLAFICKLAQGNGERKNYSHVEKSFYLFCSCVVWLDGWLAQSHYSVRRPCHLSWKRFTGPNLPRKRLFHPQFGTQLKNHQLSFAIPTWPTACMYRGAGMLLARYRPLSGGERKSKKASDFHFLLRFVWIQQLGLGVTWDWNQRKNFHFHIPNRFHIKPLLQIKQIKNKIR